MSENIKSILHKTSLISGSRVIRKATADDLDRILDIYHIARQFMTAHGNPTQWVNGYPSREMLTEDIQKGQLYVCVEKEIHKTIGVFCFVAGPDPTYTVIEGDWTSELPYHVIHRLASDGSSSGITASCLDWCFGQDHNLRIDTHADNQVMRHLLEKYGFTRCGIIYVADGTPRIAYQKTLPR